jgi:hypothetical protein
MSTSLMEQNTAGVVATANRGLLDIPGFHFSPVSLVIDDDVEFEVWEAAGRALEIAGLAIQWYLGDWLSHGERKWGEKYAQVIDGHKKTGIPINTLRDYQRVAGQVAIDVRTSEVAWSVHREVAGLPKAQQRAVLQKVKQDTDKWTQRAVKRYVQTGLEPGEKSDIDAPTLALATCFPEPSDDMKLMADKAMISFLQDAHGAVNDLKGKCPRPKFVADVLDGWSEEINDHMEQLTLNVLKDKVIKAWMAGSREETQLANMVGIPRNQIHGVMMAYKREGIFEKVVRAKTAMGKGNPPWIWHLKGQPLGSNYQPV